MRDFKMRDEPDVLPEGFQLDDPFAAEFIPEQLPGTKKKQDVPPAEPSALPPLEEAPMEDLFTGEFPLDEAVFEDFSLDEGVFEEAPTEEMIPEEIPAEDVIPEELPVEEAIPEEFPVEQVIPEELPVEEVIPEEVPVEEPIPEEPPVEEAIPEVLPVEEAIPEELPVEEALPEELPMEEPIPVALPEEEPIPEEPLAEENPETTRSPRKGRPRRRPKVALFGLPHLAAAAIWIFVILAVGVSMGRLLWFCASDVLAFGREEKLVTVSITSNDDMDSIARKLEEAGLVRSAELFKIYADFSHAEQKISTGTYTLNTLYDYHALVGQMSARSSARAIVEDVLIPEGYTCRQIFQRLEDRGICTVAELEAYAATGDLGEYWFLEGIERGHKYCLEGFLFPATYDFYENSTPKQVLTKMLNAFEMNFTQELYAQLDVLNGQLRDIMTANGKSEAYIAENLLDLRDLINVAALIEEESSGAEESPSIASVIYNRLYQWGDNPRYLNIDASIIYALDGKTDLTSTDMTVDSPYNTYTNTGLPIGPISNPGLASIKAALEPASTPYYYYVLDPEVGTHIFSKTYEEHQKNIDKVSQYVAPTEEVSYG